MEILPIIIIILIVSAIRNAIEQAKKKQQHPAKQGEQRKFPKFPDANDFPGFPGQSDFQGEETRPEAKPFVDEKIKKFRERKEAEDSMEQTETGKINDLKWQGAYSKKWDDEEVGSGSITREMTSSRRELKKGILWKEILDKPKFKKRYY